MYALEHSSLSFTLAHRSGTNGPSGFRGNCPWYDIYLLTFILLIVWTAVPAKAAAQPILYNGTMVQLSAPGGFNFPAGLALDLSGNLYIADGLNNRIVKATPDGTSSEFPISGAGTLHLPLGLAVDSAGNLYIADSNNQRIVKSDPLGNGSVLNTGNIGLNYPSGVAVDTLGHVFISDFINDQIVEITSPGNATVLSITGLSNPTSLSAPSGLATDTYNNLYIVDNGNHRLVKVTPVSPSTSLAGSGVGSVVNLASALTDAQSVTVGANGIIYVTDNVPNSSRRIAVHDPQGDNYDLFDDQINSDLGTFLWGIATDSKGAFYVSDESGNAVKLFHQGSADFGHVQVGSSSTETLNFTIEAATTVNSVTAYTAGKPNIDFKIAANTCATTNTSTPCTVNVQFIPTAAGLRGGALVLSYTTASLSGNFTVPLFGFSDSPVPALSPGVASQVSTGSTSLGQPFQTATDGSGNIYLTDTSNNRVLKIPAGGGTPTTIATGGLTLSAPTGLAIDGAGNLFIADAGNGRIVEVTAGGTAQVITINGLSGSLSNPQSLFIDGSGNMMIDDAGNNRIVQLTVSPSSPDNTLAVSNAFVLATGGVSLTTGSNSSSPYNFSTSAVVDAGESLYISDDVNNRVIKVDRFGTASLVEFSSPSQGLSIPLSTPHSLAFDPMGNLYVMDLDNAGSPRIIQQLTSGNSSVMSFSGVALGSIPNQLAVDNNGNVLIADYAGFPASSRLVGINVGQSMLSFPNTPENSTSAPMTATVTNLGDQAVFLGAGPTYTTNFSKNSSDSNLCGGGVPLLAEGMSCDVSILFTPQSVGFQSVNILIPGSTLEIFASGTASAPTPTTTTVTSSPLAPVSGQPVTFTVTVSAAGATPTGTVAFTDLTTSTALASNVTLISGVATFNTSSLAPEIHNIQAVYTPTGSFAGSTGTTNVTINKANTITSLTLSGNTLTARVAVAYPGAGTPTGMVQFLNNGAGISTGTLSSGTATAVVNLTPPYSLTAVYSGDTNFTASSSSVLTSTTTTVTFSPLSPVYGQLVITAMVSSAAGTPGGAIVFTDVTTSTTLSANASMSSGAATIMAGTLAPGSHQIVADYFPTGGNFLGSSGVATVTITKAATSTTLTLSGSTLTATVTAVAPGAGTPMGTMQFLNNGTSIGSGTLSGGTATLTATVMAPYSLTAVYSGDADFNNSTSAPLTRTGGSATGVPLTQVGPGIFRSSNGLSLLDTNFDNTFDQGDEVTLFAGNGLTPQSTDIGVVGDWNGDGTTKIGLYRPSTGTWFLDYNGNGVYDGSSVDRQYQYGGLSGDIPITGDWTGNGVTKIGIFRQGGFWLLNTTGAGTFSSSDAFFAFGGATGCTGPLPGSFQQEPAGSCDIPVVGDWNRNGKAKVGIVRAAPGTSQPFLWIVDTTGAQTFIASGPQATTVFAFGGIAGDVPLVGDWNAAGHTNVGVFRDGFLWVEDTTANLPATPAASDTLVAFPYGGIPGDQPLVGHW